MTKNKKNLKNLSIQSSCYTKPNEMDKTKKDGRTALKNEVKVIGVKKKVDTLYKRLKHIYGDGTDIFILYSGGDIVKVNIRINGINNFVELAL